MNAWKPHICRQFDSRNGKMNWAVKYDPPRGWVGLSHEKIVMHARAWGWCHRMNVQATAITREEAGHG